MTAASNERAAWAPRLATEEDIPAIADLIPLSVRALQAPHYTREQREAAIGPVFGVDRQLVRDRTYFVVESEGAIIGCGGWSRRSALFGGDQARCGEDPLLDPRAEPARVRAFFVHPAFARRGVGRSLLGACERAICSAGFRAAVIVSTLAGEPLYASFGYRVTARSAVGLPNGLELPVVRMGRDLSRPVQSPQEPQA